METFSYTHQAQYYETDQMGIIHHSNYIRWFEEARIAFMGFLGYPYDRLEKEGIISPVLEASAKYHSMVRFGDSVTIAVTIKAFNGIKLALDYEVRDKETQVLRTTGSTKHCFLNREGRPVSLKKSSPEFYETFLKFMEKAEQ